jgi:type I restriction enzyme, S subunit
MNARDLRNSILLLAIQGKLVEQREDEGTATELLEQIKAERELLIKDKKIKKLKPLPEITEEEIPFEIPQTWNWVRLGNICEKVGSGSTPTGGNSVYKQSGIKFLRSQNIYNDGLRLENIAYISEEQNKQGSTVKAKDILLNITGGSIGRCALVPDDFDIANINQHVMIIRNLVAENRYFLHYTLTSAYIQSMIMSVQVGVSREGLSAEKLNNFLIPLPPIEEQKRIVAKIEELMPYVEKYGEAHSKLELFNKKFPENIRKSILLYAIQGKLVEQRDEEGTAEALYQQIQEEKAKLIKEGKIKKEKPLPVITEDEIPFDIPDSWKWVRLGNVINLLSGQDFSPDKYNDINKGVPYITGASSLSDNGVIVNRWTEEPRCIANTGDLLLVCKGSGYGKTVICDVEEAHIARQIMSIKHSKFINTEYLRDFMSANYSLIKKKGQGVIPGIDRMSIQNMVFPMPPLAEQKRIVAKTEEIVPYCQQLIK